MLDADLLSATQLAAVVTGVWDEREATTPPAVFPDLPLSWPERYERLAAENDIDPPSCAAAADRAAELWGEMFPPDAS